MSRRPGTLLLLCLGAPGWVIAAENLYYFIDDRGVPHYSNVPADPRYKPLAQSGLEHGTPLQPTAPSQAPATAVPLAPVPPVPMGDPLPPDDEYDGDDQDR